MEFFRGFLIASVFCIAFWAIVLKCTYDWGYKNGYNERGYDFKNAHQAFVGLK